MSIIDFSQRSVHDEILSMIAQYLEDNGYQSSAQILCDEAKLNKTNNQDKDGRVSNLKQFIQESKWSMVNDIEIEKLVSPRLIYQIYRLRFLELLDNSDHGNALRFITTRLKVYRSYEDPEGDFEMLCRMLVDSASPSHASNIPDVEELKAAVIRMIDSENLVSSMETQSIKKTRFITLLKQAAAYQVSKTGSNGKVWSLLSDYKPVVLPVNPVKRLQTSPIKSMCQLGGMFLTGGSDCCLNLWDIKKCECVNSKKSHNGRIWSISSTNDIVATGSADSTVKLWNSSNLDELYTLKGHKSDVYSVCIDENRKYLVSGGYDRKICMWDIQTAQLIKALELHEGSVTSLLFDSTGNILVSGGKDHIVQLWDTRNNFPIKKLGPVLGEVSSIAADSTFTHIIAATKDSTNRMWDLRMTDSVMLFKGHRNSSKQFVKVRFGPDDRTVMSGSDDGYVYTWDSSTGELLSKIHSHNGGVYDMQWVKEERTFVSYGETKDIVVWSSE